MIKQGNWKHINWVNCSQIFASIETQCDLLIILKSKS